MDVSSLNTSYMPGGRSSQTRSVADQGFDAMVVGTVSSGNASAQALNTEYRDALFALSDSNHDGQLTQDEVARQVSSGGGDEEQADSLWNSLAGGQQSIDHDQFKGQLAAGASPEAGTLGGVAVNIFDADGNGKLTEAEIERLLQKTGHRKETAVQLLQQLSSFTPVDSTGKA